MSKLSAVATLLPGSALDVHSIQYPPSVTAECVGWWRVEMMYWQGEFISLVGLLQPCTVLGTGYYWAQLVQQPTISTIQSPASDGSPPCTLERFGKYFFGFAKSAIIM